MQKDLFVSFFVYAKSFDKSDHEELVKILEDINSDGKDLRMMGVFIKIYIGIK